MSKVYSTSFKINGENIIYQKVEIEIKNNFLSLSFNSDDFRAKHNLNYFDKIAIGPIANMTMEANKLALHMNSTSVNGVQDHIAFEL